MALYSQGHALVVGVGTYQQSDYSVPITLGDAKGVYDALIDPGICAYPPDQVTFRHDGEATRAQVLQDLAALAKRTYNADDTVMIFLCGHGGGAGAQWNFATHDAQIESYTGIVDGTGISTGELLTAFRGIQAKKVLLIINACFSGAVSSVLDAQKKPTKVLGSAPPDELTLEVLKTGEGRAILTASAPDQSSYFDTNATRTIFGDALIEGLNGSLPSRSGYIGLFELYDTLYDQVTEGAERLHGKQQPVITVLQNIGKFPIALHRGKTPGNLGEAGLKTKPGEGTAGRALDPIQFGPASAGRDVNQNIAGGDINQGMQAGGNINTGIQASGPVIQGSTFQGDFVGRDKFGGDRVEGDKNEVTIGNNAQIGQFAVGKNIRQTETRGVQSQDLASLFQAIYQRIDEDPELAPNKKKEVKNTVEYVQEEAAKGSSADTKEIERWLGQIKQIAPDILKVTAAALLNPLAGVASAIQVVAERVRSAN
jgi:hypothetical protein